jgi:hypothetical protein
MRIAGKCAFAQEGERLRKMTSSNRTISTTTVCRMIKIVKSTLDLGSLVGVQDGTIFDLSGDSIEQVFDGLLPDIGTNCGWCLPTLQLQRPLSLHSLRPVQSKN